MQYNFHSNNFCFIGINKQNQPATTKKKQKNNM